MGAMRSLAAASYLSQLWASGVKWAEQKAWVQCWQVRGRKSLSLQESRWQDEPMKRSWSSAAIGVGGVGGESSERRGRVGRCLYRERRPTRP